MGRLQGPYNPDFPPGTTVRIAGRKVLERFLAPVWDFHHPLDQRQLEHADRLATVRAVSYHRGGDELYELDGLDGIWHEACLRAADDAADA
ncbi:MAG: hypothetical protein ACREMF_11450 [Gemmatimonadales bacterium]